MDHNREDLVNSVRVRCPRCGYDQRGVATAWHEACPLHGVCSECGLRFRWAELFLSERFEPRWCVEYAKLWLRVPRACFATLLRSFLPWRFWARLSMAYRVRWGRLGLYVAFLLLLPALMYVPYQMTKAILVRRTLVAQWATVAADYRRAAAENQAVLNSWPLSAPGMTDADMNLQRQQLQNTTNWYMTLASGTITISQSLLQSILEAIFLPFRTTSSATVAYPDGSIGPYPSPAEHASALASGTIAQTNLYAERVAAQFRAVGSVLMSAMLIALFPIAFILLPVSRRRAKVRWPHLWRITAYSAFIPVIVAIICLAGHNLSLMGVNWPILTRLEQNMALATLVFVPIWWTAAIRHYLRMPHAVPVAVLLTLMLALILSPLVLAASPPWVEKAIFDW